MSEAAATVTSDQDVLRRVHELYEAVVWRVRRAAEAMEAGTDVGPLRAALGQVFESVVVRWPTPQDFDDATVFEVPGQRGLFLEPRLRREVFAADTDMRSEQWATLKRVAIDLGIEPHGLDESVPYTSENNSTGSGVPL